MKKISILIMPVLMAGMAFTSCSDYLDVDKYFYDQMTLDSAFSKRQYVEGWLANAFEPIDQLAESDCKTATTRPRSTTTVAKNCCIKAMSVYVRPAH